MDRKETLSPKHASCIETKEEKKEISKLLSYSVSRFEQYLSKRSYMAGEGYNNE